MTTPVPPVPTGLAGVTAYLTVDDASAAIDFYEKSFGAIERPGRLESPDGKIMHTTLEIAGTGIMLADEFPAMEALGPNSLGDTPVKLNLFVDDAAAVVDTAVANGAELLMPVERQFYGHVAARVRDPFGHSWIVSTQVEALTAQEMQDRFQKLFPVSGDGSDA